MRTREKRRIVRLFLTGHRVHEILAEYWSTIEYRHMSRNEIEDVIRKEMIARERRAKG